MKKIISLVCVGIVIIIGFMYVQNNTEDISFVSPSPSVTAPIKPTVKPTITATTKPSTTPVQNVLLSVPFTSQAPFGNWADPKEENGCEEASAIMAMYWVTEKTLTPTIALAEIIAVADYEKKTYGHYIDTSADDTVTRIFNGYFKYTKATVQKDITIADIIAELGKGHVIIVPINGQKIGNSYYKQPGPREHMMVIKGYDRAKNQFITNDPGTRRGESYAYTTDVLFNSIYDYDSGGNHDHGGSNQKVMIVVTK